MFADIVVVAKELQGIQSRLTKAGKEERISLSEYLGNISDCIDDIIKRYKNKEDLNTRCAELEIYGQESGEILVSILGDDKGIKLGKAIETATYSRSGMAPGFLLRDEDGASISRLNDLQKAAGMLRATSNILKAPPARSKSLWGIFKQKLSRIS